MRYEGLGKGIGMWAFRLQYNDLAAELADLCLNIAFGRMPYPLFEGCVHTHTYIHKVLVACV